MQGDLNFIYAASEISKFKNWKSCLNRAFQLESDHYENPPRGGPTFCCAPKHQRRNDIVSVSQPELSFSKWAQISQQTKSVCHLDNEQGQSSNCEHWFQFLTDANLLNFSKNPPKRKKKKTPLLLALAFLNTWQNRRFVNSFLRFW